MRTTLEIDDTLLRQLRAMQRREGITLGALVSRLLARALEQKRQAASRAALTWTARPMGALVDPSDKEAVGAILDERSS